jgi:adenylate cyclase
VEISAELNWDTLTRLILQQAVSLLDTSAASLMLLDEAENAFTIKAWRGLGEAYAHRERIPSHQFLHLLTGTARSFQITDLGQQSLGRSDLLRREGVVSQLSLSLVAAGRFVGLLNLYSRNEPRQFGSDEVKLAETFAQQVAIALANARLLEHTREERGKLSAVLSSTTDAVLVIDGAGNLVMANPAAEQTLGLDTASSMEQPLAGKVPAPLLQIFEQGAASGQSISAEILTAQERNLYVSVSPVMGVGQVAVVQDITPLKELETMRLKAEQDQRRLIRQMFERYVGPRLVDRILAQEAGLLERRERRDVVVLFADLRGFSEFTATYPAHTVIEVLNEFFTAMVDIVHLHQGTIFDLAGDELMVGFGAPFVQADAASRALHVAGNMQQTFSQLRHQWQEQQGIEIGLGIGLDWGSVVMGSIGAPSHMNFGMVGDVVNTAHRLVELAQQGQIILSGAVLESMDKGPEGWSFEELPHAEVTHRSTPMRIFLARPEPPLAS